jgi:hypothetical protein
MKSSEETERLTALLDTAARELAALFNTPISTSADMVGLLRQWERTLSACRTVVDEPALAGVPPEALARFRARTAALASAHDEIWDAAATEGDPGRAIAVLTRLAAETFPQRDAGLRA